MTLDVRKIKSVHKVDAAIKIPPSKSLTNRGIIIASLANGASKLINCSSADDCVLMLNAVKKFGVEFEKYETDLLINGTSGKLKTPDSGIYVGNAGTVMRFVCGFASLANGITILAGDENMARRPIGELAHSLQQLGIKIETNNGFPPVKISGGKLSGGKVKLNASISSQFVSSLLMISPYAESDVELEISETVPSKPYINITLDMMRHFGIDVAEQNNSFFISSNKTYKAETYSIEGDASSSSYFLAAAAITSGKIVVQNLKLNSKQGDIKFLKILEEMGCSIAALDNGVEIVSGGLKGITIDMNDVPDLVPTLSIVALFAEGKTRIENVKHLRFKESDRLSALAAELRKLGARVQEFDDGLEITPGKYSGGSINTYNDHRIAMSFAIAGLRIPGVQIENPSCVVKSFPDFWSEFEKLEYFKE